MNEREKRKKRKKEKKEKGKKKRLNEKIKNLIIITINIHNY